MNPDKLFDYLDGSLPSWERAQLEEQLASDPQLQKELAMARRIHSQTLGESREVLLETEDALVRGRRMALRVGVAFIILVGLNVAIGLWLIARQESSNPNRKLLETQMREQINKSLEQATHSALTPPPLDIIDLTISAAPGRLSAVADQIVATAKRLGGSATKELPDIHRIGVLADVPANRETEFRSALAVMSGGVPPSPSPNDNTAAGVTKKSFVIQIVEAGSP